MECVLREHGRPVPVSATDRKPFTSNGICIPAQADEGIMKFRMALSMSMSTRTQITHPPQPIFITNVCGGSGGHVQTIGPKDDTAWWRIRVVPQSSEQQLAEQHPQDVCILKSYGIQYARKPGMSLKQIKGKPSHHNYHVQLTSPKNKNQIQSFHSVHNPAITPGPYAHTYAIPSPRSRIVSHTSLGNKGSAQRHIQSSHDHRPTEVHNKENRALSDKPDQTTVGDWAHGSAAEKGPARWEVRVGGDVVAGGVRDVHVTTLALVVECVDEREGIPQNVLDWSSL